MNKKEAKAIKVTVHTDGWKYIHKNLTQIYDKCADDALKCTSLAELRGKQEIRKFIKSFNGRIQQALEIAGEK
jgi:hypothetical protein